MRLLYRFLSNFLCTCMLVSSAVLVCCMDMQDRVWLSVSDNLHARAVPWMCGASRDAHAFASAGARRPRRFIAKAACRVVYDDAHVRSEYTERTTESNDVTVAAEAQILRRPYLGPHTQWHRCQRLSCG